jgi:uncharacterized protein (TIGR02118 family)
MIKRITLLVRKDGITHPAFREYWYANHGKIVRQMPAVARYLQNPVLPEQSEDVGRSPPYQFDGIVELWFADEAAQKEAFGSPAAKLLPLDEPNFIKGITILGIAEGQLRAESARVKAMLVLNLGPDLDKDARAHALAEIEFQAEKLPGILRLVANRVTANSKRNGLWSEPTPPALILELGTETPTAMANVLGSAGFDDIRARVCKLNGRMAVRLVEERRLI